MLIEIQSDAFRSNGNPRSKIIFHEGLNTILGGMNGDNSIGKSTFLQIIDYTFGGNTYLDSDAAKKMGAHTINFAFKFNEKIEYYSRGTSEKDVVNICNKSYEIIDNFDLKKFTAHLFKSYGINIQDLTFRDLVSLFFRMQGKGNITPNRPLSIVANEKTEKSILRLEKIFDVYWKIKEYEKIRSIANDKKKSYNRALKLELIPNSTTTKKKRDINLKEIQLLKDELYQYTSYTDKEISSENIQQINQISTLRGQVTSFKRKLSRVKSQLSVVAANVKSAPTIVTGDLEEFAYFFPMADIKTLEDIQRFHHKIVGVLDDELKSESVRLTEVARTIEKEIYKLEDQIRNLGEPVNIPQRYIGKLTDLTSRINSLEKQNETYEMIQKLKSDYESAQQKLSVAQGSQLEIIQSTINKKLKALRDTFSDNRFAPILEIKDNESYKYYTPDDDGTGTIWVGLILFDFAILQLTILPAIAHDSLMFKNIEDESIDAIIRLYEQSSKQVFLAFDKEGTYLDTTKKVLQDSAILRLNKGGNELFGYQWGKKN